MKKLSSVVAIVGLFLWTTVSAETFLSKDWVWNTDDEDFYFAATVNEEGHLLGQYCYFKSASCLYVVRIGINCKEGEQYPALINSDSGTYSVNLLCGGNFEQQNLLFVNNFDGIDNIIRSSARIGIAVPEQGDLLKVSRFSLAGSISAIDSMRSAATTRMKSKPQNRSLPADEGL